MSTLKSKKSMFVIVCISLLFGGLTANVVQTPEAQKEEYLQELSRIQAMRESLNPQPDREAYRKDPEGYIKQLMASRDKNDLDAYEKFANGILNKWASGTSKYYGRLAVELCKPLSSGLFQDERRANLARKYALAALEKLDDMPLDLELELIGHVMTHPELCYSPQGQEYAEHRRKDVEVRLRAWKRLHGAIDPTWDQTEIIPSPNAVAAEFGLPGTVDPQGIKDPAIRAEYEAAIEDNSRKLKNKSEQLQWRDWVKRYTKNLETYLPYLYSSPPYDNEELQQTLEAFALDEAAKVRIIDTVTKNIEAHIQSKNPN